MPLIRWVRDLGQPQVPGIYEVRHMLVGVTARDINTAEKYLRSASSKDVVFVARIPQEPSEACRLGSIICIDPVVTAHPEGRDRFRATGQDLTAQT